MNFECFDTKSDRDELERECLWRGRLRRVLFFLIEELIQAVRLWLKRALCNSNSRVQCLMLRFPPGGRCGGWASETWLMGCIRFPLSRFSFHLCLSLLSFLLSPLCAISSPFLVLCPLLPSRLSTLISRLFSLLSSLLAPLFSLPCALSLRGASCLPTLSRIKCLQSSFAKVHSRTD